MPLVSAPLRRATGTVGLLTFSSLLSAALGFSAQALLARVLLPSEYGLVAAALTTVTLLAPLPGFGIPALWLKVFGAEGAAAMRWLPPSLRFSALSTLLVLLSLVAWAKWGPHEASTGQMLYWLLPVVLSHLFASAVGARLQLEARYQALALWVLLANLLRFSLLWLLIMAMDTVHPQAIGAAYALAACVVAVVGFVQLRTMSKGQFRLAGHGTPGLNEEAVPSLARRIGLLDVIREARPFGLGEVFHLIYFQSDVVLLSYIVGNEAAGIYHVAFIAMTVVYLVPSTVFQRFLLPKVHRWANHDRARFLQVYRFGNGVMLAAGGLAAAGILLLSGWIVPRLFGPAYAEAAGLLSILAFCAPMRFLASSVGATLVTQDHMRRKSIYMGAVAVENVLLNLWLIPALGARGAAIATLVSETTLLALYLLAVRCHVFGRDAWRGWTLRY